MTTTRATVLVLHQEYQVSQDPAKGSMGGSREEASEKPDLIDLGKIAPGPPPPF